MKKMIRGLAALVTVSGPVVASAESAYLDCEMQGDRGDYFKFQIKVDEGSGKITHTQENGLAFNAEGFFASNTISYQKIDLVGGLKITLRYEINRSTLVVTRSMIIGSGHDGSPMTGKCELTRVSDRKI